MYCITLSTSSPPSIIIISLAHVHTRRAKARTVCPHRVVRSPGENCDYLEPWPQSYLELD